MSIECINYKQHASGALQGFADFRVGKMGIELFGCGVFMSNGRRWVSLPSREYTDHETGEKKYINILRFMKKEHNQAFGTSALQALDMWCGEQSISQEAPAETVHHSAPVEPVLEDGVPF